jgi:hypothetical protein
VFFLAVVKPGSPSLVFVTLHPRKAGLRPYVHEKNESVWFVMNVDDLELKALSVAVLEHAARDAQKGDPMVAGWFLGDMARMWADCAEIGRGVMAKIAYNLLEGFYYGE